MGKLRAPLAFAMLSVLLVTAGCGTSSTTSNGADLTKNNGNVTPPWTYPIVKQKETLTVFTQQDANVEDYNTNAFTKWYEDKTNIHVNWQVVPTSGAADKLQVTLAGGNLPDVLMMSGVTDSQLVDYGSQGMFLPLNQLIDKYAPNIKKMMEQAPYIKPYMYAPDGNIYAIPNVGEIFHSTMPKKMWIYKPWLDKLGLKVPTTTDELYQVLKAFKTQDPNGKGNEVPFAGATQANNDPQGFILQSFIYYNPANYLYMNNGKIEFAADKPAYRDGLKYLSKLGQGGLLAPESFTQDRNALTALAEDPAADRLGAATALVWGQFTVDHGPSGRYKDYVPVPVLAGPDGKRYGYDGGYSVTPGGFVITKDAKDPVAAIRWMDWFFNEQQKLNEGFTDHLGQEGVGWKKPDPGTLGLDGRPATYQFLIQSSTKQNYHWNNSAPGYQTNDYRLSDAATPQSETEQRLFAATNQFYKPYSDAAQQVPHMFFSDADLAKNGDLTKNIANVVQQFQVKFITGKLDINNDNDWNQYLKELDNAGLKQYVQIYNDNYAKQKK